MNYFGHAVVASWKTGHGGLPLGAMLPDFSTMCGARVVGSDDEDVATGITLHHATDSVFHQAAVVTGLMRELDHRLERGGCARGPRRAVAHIGVELLLDGVLVDVAEYRDAYILGLEYEALDRTIDAHVMNLRRKLERDRTKPELIQTVFGVGYRFRKDGSD